MRLTSWLNQLTPGIPIICDLDGTLVRCDTLEVLRNNSSIAGLDEERKIQREISKSAEKIYLWQKCPIPLDYMPFDSEVIDSLLSTSGHPLLLVTGSSMELGESVNSHLKLFDEVYGSYENTNLTGSNKAKFLVEKFGHEGFAYIGDSQADVPVWQVAISGAFIQRDGKQITDLPQNVEIIPSRPMITGLLD